MTAPVEIVGDGEVDGIMVERNGVMADGVVAGAGERETIPVGMVVTAVGDRDSRLAAVRFDEDSGTVPNAGGRVVRDGSVVYVTGWLKSGPTCIIGTNRPDGAETAAGVLEDLSTGPRPAAVRSSDVLDLLAERSCRPVDWSGWPRLESTGPCSVRPMARGGSRCTTSSR